MGEKVSVIMPSYLGDYEGAAKDRKDKLIRAIESFKMNKYDNKELVIVGDNCSETYVTLVEKFKEDLDSGLIKFYNCKKKQKLFSGKLRTIGLKIANGKFIMYLDSDDMYGESHIQTIISQFSASQCVWSYFNDFVLSETNELVKKEVTLNHGSIGTSSIVHINHPKLNWRFCNGYGHDWKFIKKLMKFSNDFEKIFGGTYIICHIPNMVDN